MSMEPSQTFSSQNRPACHELDSRKKTIDNTPNEKVISRKMADSIVAEIHRLLSEKIGAAGTESWKYTPPPRYKVSQGLQPIESGVGFLSAEAEAHAADLSAQVANYERKGLRKLAKETCGDNLARFEGSRKVASVLATTNQENAKYLDADQRERAAKTGQRLRFCGRAKYSVVFRGYVNGSPVTVGKHRCKARACLKCRAADSVLRANQIKEVVEEWTGFDSDGLRGYDRETNFGKRGSDFKACCAVTYTVPRALGGGIKENLEAYEWLKRARSLLSDRYTDELREQFGLEGYVYAHDVTFGKDGTHHHFHELAFLDYKIGDDRDMPDLGRSVRWSELWNRALVQAARIWQRKDPSVLAWIDVAERYDEPRFEALCRKFEERTGAKPRAGTQRKFRKDCEIIPQLVQRPYQEDGRIKGGLVAELSHGLSPEDWANYLVKAGRPFKTFDHYQNENLKKAAFEVAYSGSKIAARFVDQKRFSYEELVGLLDDPDQEAKRFAYQAIREYAVTVGGTQCFRWSLDPDGLGVSFYEWVLDKELDEDGERTALENLSYETVQGLYHERDDLEKLDAELETKQRTGGALVDSTYLTTAKANEVIAECKELYVEEMLCRKLIKRKKEEGYDAWVERDAVSYLREYGRWIEGDASSVAVDLLRSNVDLTDAFVAWSRKGRKNARFRYNRWSLLSVGELKDRLSGIDARKFEIERESAERIVRAEWEREGVMSRYSSKVDMEYLMNRFWSGE